MSNGFLSQEEIDSLLNGGSLSPEPEVEEMLSDIEKDLLGEIGNISMGSASTALSTIINQQVNITTPVVTVTTLKKLKNDFEVPNIALEVRFTSGIVGENLLVMKITDAAIIANLMMGGDGKVESHELTEIEISAVSEAMNQMIGSAATSMATMFSREVNIAPPSSTIWSDSTNKLSNNIDENENIIQVSFRLTIGSLVDSTIMQILPMETAKKVISIMMGTENSEPAAETVNVKPAYIEPQASFNFQEPSKEVYVEPAFEKRTPEPQVEIHKASFQPLKESSAAAMPRNIDLILDVPLEISVVLGRTKKNIKDILSLGTGSLIELDKLAEEPVEILVNGKIVAYGEVVVVDENFGVRITSIVSGAERVKSLSR
ncbi:flagellar motor switch phosphatase FliY [Clostridium sp. SYSU_GA19001]|uniref:flagellar motor switch phosphatase FliY n=1 Tax=Clostridium caldaquaticum TaxID=2940653 RepID=UPI002076DE68|nr:flagellar motor switch phosphatase FliY [Clostridium caldaquaticum]MCM8710951.1 flagellar motor switch phosphatase FliY [Clostridium caldaquaticum]